MQMKSIYSMTGYATEKITFPGGEITCELRTLNSRYMEIYLKLPQQLKSLEDHYKTFIRKYIDRAKVNCIISINETEDASNIVQLNKPLVKAYVKLLKELKNTAGVASEIELSDLMQFKDIFVVEDSQPDDSLKTTVEDLLERTIASLNTNRAEEGNNLRADMLNRLENIKKLAEEVAGYAKENARMEFERQYKRLKKLIDESKIDRDRLELEIAVISDRVDISEELVRLKSHIELFQEDLAQGSPIGKKLNFILQEMHREANTMSSKNTMIEISHRVVAIKEEIERMREQVQNLE
jgi:uncharacterized protein (TIGR00255 family)